VKAVAETAREEALIEGEEKGRIEGKIEGRIEGKIEGKEERDIELIKDFSQQGMTAQAISNLLKIPSEKVRQIIGELPKN
jgi:predicted transposase YdaD